MNKVVCGNSTTQGVARMLVSATVTGNKPKAMMFNDISRAYIYGRTSSDMYVELCEEDKTEPGDENKCGKLLKSMYGTRERPVKKRRVV